MPIYLVTYDLNKESSSEDYKPLWADLKRLGAHRALESVWLVNVTNTTNELGEHLKRLVDGNDSLFVTKLRQGEIWRFRNKAGTTEWLEKNPPS